MWLNWGEILIQTRSAGISRVWLKTYSPDSHTSAINHKRIVVEHQSYERLVLRKEVTLNIQGQAITNKKERSRRVFSWISFCIRQRGPWWGS